MPKLMSIDDLKKLREESRRDIAVRLKTGTRIIIGMGTCGIAAGAREVLQAFLKELGDRKIDAHLETVGCVGLCAQEPLVDIEQAGKSRVRYATSARKTWPGWWRSIWCGDGWSGNGRSAVSKPGVNED